MENKNLTIFVLTCSNNPNYEACLEALSNQTMTAKIEIIKNVYPISNAFQEMFDRCKTRYAVQCDEDMILYPHAIETLYNTIVNAQPKTVLVCYQLHDVHLNFDLFGIKIYDCEIYKQFPLRKGTFSGSLNQMAEIKNAGYKEYTNLLSIGLHSPEWTEELIFNRYFDLIDKYRTKQYTWMEELPYKLYQIYKNNPTELNLYAFLGSIINILCNNEKPIEKNFGIKNQYCEKLNQMIKHNKMPSNVSVPLPTSATLSMTTKCEFKCNFCLRQSQQIESAPDMSVEKIQEILKIFPTIRSFCLCGFGEPTLCENFDSILQYLNENKIGMGLITNGSNLINKIPILIKYKPNYVSISLNAPNQEIHSRITNTQDLFDKVLEGIRLSVSNKLTTYLTYVCDKTNLLYIPDFLKVAKSLKVKGVYLFNILPHHLITNQTKEEFLSLVLTNKDQKIIDSFRALPESDIVLEYPILINPDKQERFCSFAWKKMTINGNGSISVCNSIFPPNKQNGNIIDQNVWLNNYCSRFRENFDTNNLPLACSLCWRNYVGGK